MKKTESTKSNSSTPTVAWQADASNYWNFYQCQFDPFDPSYDTRQAVYMSDEWQVVSKRCQSALATENGMLYVSSEKGLGKTIWLKGFLETLEGEHYQIFQASNVNEMTVNQFITACQSAYALQAVTAETQEGRLDELVEMLQFEDKTALFVVDDAESLPEETLQALFYMLDQQSEAQMRFHVLLVGGKDLQAKLESLAEKGEYGHLLAGFHLSPLSAAEVETYVNMRMQAAGYQDDQVCSLAQLHKIYKMSQGYPVRINRVAKQHLVKRLQAPKKRAEGSKWLRLWHWHRVTVIGGVAVLALLAPVLVISLPNGNQQDMPTLAAVKQNWQGVTSRWAAEWQSYFAVQSAKKQQKQQAKRAEQARKRIEAQEAQQAKLLAAQQEKQQAEDESEFVSNHSEESQLDSDSTTEQAPTREEQGLAFKNMTEEYKAPLVIETPQLPESLQKAIPEQAEKLLNDKAEQEESSEGASAQAEQQDAVAEEIALQDELGERYIVQLMALPELDKLQAIQANYEKQSPGLYRIYYNPTRELHIMTYGSFENAKLANQAIQALPQALKKAGPWPKQVSLVHNEMQDKKSNA